MKISMAITTLETTQLLEQLQSIDGTSLSDQDARVQVLAAARALCRRLETPYEWVLRMTWEEVSWQLRVKFSSGQCCNEIART